MLQVGKVRGRKLGVVAATALTLVVGVATASPAGATPAPVPEVQLVVKLTDHVATHPGDVLDGLPGSLPRPAAANRWSLQVPAGEVSTTLARLRADSRVQYATQSQRVHATDMPNDPCFVSTCGPPKVINGDSGAPVSATQGDLLQIGAPAAWSVTHGTSSVLVAVLDTGVESTQVDLAGQVTAGPVLCAGDDPLCVGAAGQNTDDNGHGTHVTGTVAAHTDNGVGVASLGWNTRAETFKVLDSQGGGSTLDLATGILDAVAAGASVINMSLGNSGCSVDPTNCGPDPDTMAAVEYAQAHNVVVVAAAGNGNDTLTGGSTDPTYPASYPGVLSVAAVDSSGSTTAYSEYGGAANVAAPGNNILSTWNSPDDHTYALLTGTSMATPHVSAAAALLRAADPTMSAAQVVSVLQTSAAPLGGRQINGGLLDVPAALDAARTGAAFAGYRMAGADGSVYSFGAEPSFGDLAGRPLTRPVVALSGRADHTGYWTTASDGGVFAFGHAGFYGSTGGMRLNQPVVGMAATPDGGGYWLVASDGGIFAFGDAGFFGSTGAMRLNKPIVGMASTADGRGYWLVASDGGIFAFGDAGFFGSTGSFRLNQPVVGMAARRDGGGYWLVASDGGIFAFGAAGFFGSTGNLRLNRPVDAMLATSDSGGYLLAADDGGLFAFGDARFEGSVAGHPIPGPVVGIAG